MKVALIGYGKMGKEIENILTGRGHTIPLIIDIDNASDLDAAHLAGIDVAIEFTTPQTAFGNIMTCLEAGIPVVCGTTGWLDRFEEVKEACRLRNGAFFYASNYSVGVNVFFEVNRRLAELMERFPEYDVTVEETHHTQKKDAPSGTAITIAEGILENLSRKQKWVCGVTTVPEELEVTAVRRSIVPGTHTVTYESAADQITFTHRANGRRGFAMGAVLAAEFLCGKQGVYTMKDLLGLD
ncbi:MAG TPA: 4-hydroxy-tetrahydrodipicolinate reductase [Candidatus Alistipes merdigallinarum]|nr:4-hydroxy-tetrahydrodipicolinate reductase [Candidatus Alistipes merdigallinarum]